MRRFIIKLVRLMLKGNACYIEYVERMTYNLKRSLLWI